jgi:membrane protease subunit (stomatin/prohibitin family)
MGIFEKLKGEFIDIIEWLDNSSDTLVYRFERYGNEIKYNAKLVVRESQLAVFVNEGQIADVFTPGTHTLQTQNMPILSTLKGWKYGFQSPFKAEVYFVSTRKFTDRKWGTKNPIILRDPEFGPVRLRAFGSYAFRATEAAVLIREVAGTDAHFSIDEITEQLRNIIITRFSDMLAESRIPAIDLAARYNELSQTLQGMVNEEYAEYGLELTSLLIENVSFPPEVEEAIDKRSSMGVIGDLSKYMQYQAGLSMSQAATNPGGGASDGIGMGMGFAMANQMAHMYAPQQGGTPPPPPSVSYYLAVNGQQQGPYGIAQLQQMAAGGQVTPKTLAWKAGMSAWQPVETLPDLSTLFGAVPPPPPPVPPL